MNLDEILTLSPLGKGSKYITNYTPALLFAIPRSGTREEIKLTNRLPFHGIDIWTAFELSWLNPKGKPEAAIGEFHFSCHSENLIESKSLKLYLNSFSHSPFSSFLEVQKVIAHDLSLIAKAPVEVKLVPLTQWSSKLERFPGTCLDDLDVHIDTYNINPSFLATGKNSVQETVFSDLLKSNCLVTGQPDWGSVMIKYAGPQINHEGLFKYIISFRDHQGFHEQCIERIFCDILEKCEPTQLTVYGRYTRRGGLDINMFRSNFENAPPSLRLARQ